MTAQTIEQPTASPWWPKKTLADVVRVLTGDVDDDIREEFQAALEAAGDEAKGCNCFDPLTVLVETWWPQAVFWADSAKARETLARMKRYQREGPPPLEQRHSAAEVKAALEARHGRPMGPAWAKLAKRG